MRGFGAVNVGTVANFQGQEQDVIIISTVLHNLKWLEENKKSSQFGTLKAKIGDVKSFNVAITRAKSFLLVLGNAAFLQECNSSWRHLLEYCAEEKTRRCRGREFEITNLSTLLSESELLPPNLLADDEEEFNKVIAFQMSDKIADDDDIGDIVLI